MINTIQIRDQKLKNTPKKKQKKKKEKKKKKKEGKHLKLVRPPCGNIIGLLLHKVFLNWLRKTPPFLISLKVFWIN